MQVHHPLRIIAQAHPVVVPLVILVEDAMAQDNVRPVAAAVRSMITIRTASLQRKKLFAIAVFAADVDDVVYAMGKDRSEIHIINYTH